MAGASAGVEKARARLAIAAVALIAGTPVASEPFYLGKTLSIVVGTQSGGGFDINSRMLARHIGRHIPGRPNVIVANMVGAGSLMAVRHLETAAPRDGTVVVNFNFGLIGMSRLVPDRAPIDFRKFAWIGSISQDLTTCYLWHTFGVRSLADLKARKDVHFGLSSPGGNEDFNQRILKSVFGVDLKQVGGYPGSAALKLALERGELDGACGSWNSVPEDWIAKKLIVPVYRTGETPDPDMPPGLPSVLELAGTPRDRAIVRLLTAHNELGRPYVVSSAVPADRVEILRQAFEATMADPELLADAARLRMPVSPRTAAQAMRIVDEIYATPDDVVAAARKVMGE